MGQILGLCSQTPLGELAKLSERMKIDAKKVKHMRLSLIHI